MEYDEDQLKKQIAFTIADRDSKTNHSQMCPTYRLHKGIDECDCWILKDAFLDADAVVRNVVRPLLTTGRLE